ncbi:Uncharacterised protein [Mycobacteroides abscessus subsp. abscessus]|nr:Uncharacterised protein [Mycobacteroides abscessus subsp. abscessus]
MVVGAAAPASELAVKFDQFELRAQLPSGLLDLLDAAALARLDHLVLVQQKHRGSSRVDQLLNLGPPGPIDRSRKPIGRRFANAMRLVADQDF